MTSSPHRSPAVMLYQIERRAKPLGPLEAIWALGQMRYDFGSAIWIMAIYAHELSLSGLAILIAEFVRAQRLFRAQTGAILIGGLICLAGTVLTLAGAAPTFHGGITPFTCALGSPVVAWGLFRYRLFDVVPVARDVVIANMSDGVSVLLAQGRAVGLNPAAQRAIGRTGAGTIELPVAAER